MRAIIIAAGKQTRWANYLNTPKHLVTIGGEVMLHRTVRQLKDRGVTDIVVVGPDHRYDVDDTDRFAPKLDYENNADADKFLSSQSVWNAKGRTVIFYGDVYFTDYAMDTIVGYEGKEWRLFCRPGASKVTGTKWGECFAVSFYPADHERSLEQLRRIAALAKSGKINRCGGWEWVRAMMGKPDAKIRHPHVLRSDLYVVIDDVTDDIDYPDDYERIKKVVEGGHHG